jgi:3-oxoacyl-[acyl-carrier protein] reductase
MNLLLQDQVALVTGSSRGIGLAVAEMLALEGVTVILNGVNEQRLAAAVSLLTAKDLSVIGIPGDVSDKHTAERIFSEISRQHERFDILVNNAGIYPHGSNMLEMSEEHWDQAISVNLKSVFNCSRLAAQAMIRHGNGGVILNATSFGAKIPSWGTIAYAATKAAIYNMTLTMAAELAPHNIRVNSYMPGVIATDMTSSIREKK